MDNFSEISKETIDDFYNIFNKKAFVVSTKFEFDFIDPTIFGYHELFHVLSLFAAFFVYQISYSAAVRYKDIKEGDKEEEKEDLK